METSLRNGHENEVFLQPRRRRFDRRASMVLIGMRGAGKRSLAFIAAAHLGWRLISEAVVFQHATGLCKADFLRVHGAAELVTRSLAVLTQTLNDNAEECVVECGMATLTAEAQSMLRTYAQTHPVVHITRAPEDMAAVLGLPADAALRLTAADSHHRACTNYEFYNAHDPGFDRNLDNESDPDPSVVPPLSLRNVQVDFRRYVDFITGQELEAIHGEPFSLSTLSPHRRPRSYMSTIRLSQLLTNGAKLRWSASGEDAVELVIDVCGDNVLRQISFYIALMRRHIELPIVYSVSREATSGRPGHADLYSELLEHGLRHAVDYLVVDLECPHSLLQSIVQEKCWTKIIGHQHFHSAPADGWHHPSRGLAFEEAALLDIDVVRLTQHASCRKDNADVRRFRDIMTDLHLNPTLIAYNVGRLGRTSVIENAVLCPVQSNRLGNRNNDEPADDLSVAEVTNALFHTFEFDSLSFYVVGANTSYSRGPQMHTAAYKLLGLRHRYTSKVIATFDEALALWHGHDFGGSAVSFPYKEQAFQACETTSTHAKAVGSINTVMPLRTRTSLLAEALERNRSGLVHALYGDNSDWYGVYINIKRKISPRNMATISKSTGLVLGAGGSARSAVYALIQLQCRNIFVLNRTPANAERVADHFNSWARRALALKTPIVHTLQPQDPNWPGGFELPIIVVACIPTNANKPGQSVPASWLQNPRGGVVADVSLPCHIHI